MTQHNVNWFALLGVLLLLAGGIAAWREHRRLRAGPLGKHWKAIEPSISVIGVVLGVVLATWTINPSPTVKTVGFPFLAAAFEKTPTGQWADFVGLLTLPAFVGNFAVGVLVPHLFLSAISFVLPKRDTIHV